MKAFMVIFFVACTSARLSAGPLLILDPGHGGSESGVHAEGLTEADLTLSIALEVQQQLKAQGVECALTRGDNSSLGLSQRAGIANVSGARAFVSLHLNHSPSPYTKGVRIFLPKPGLNTLKDEPLRWNSAASGRVEEARPLAFALAKALTTSQTQKVSVQNLNMGIFKGLSLPAVVVELGFLSHSETAKNFKDSDYRKTVAARLVTGIRVWSDSIGATLPGVSATATVTPAGAAR